MNEIAYLVLEDGSVYPGESIGASGTVYGEVVFNTSMTGYQEILTDPSYAGQIVVATYPLIGNYGINAQSVESKNIQVEGYVMREHSMNPSHRTSTTTIHDYLAIEGVPGLSGVDTRAVTRHIRSQGAMMGCITSEMSADVAFNSLQKVPRYVDLDYVAKVSTKHPYLSKIADGSNLAQQEHHIVVADCGLKYNILRKLEARNCVVTIVPAITKPKDILAMNPDGVMFSPGPGDPNLLDYAVDVVKGLVGHVPIMGICLGHQLLAKAFGAQTYKLKFGHHGGNHPVQDLATGLLYITAQNHGFAVDADTLPSELEVSHVNLNDGTIEGIVHKVLPILGIQFHSEAAPGPWDNEYLFDRFLSMIKEVPGS